MNYVSKMMLFCCCYVSAGGVYIQFIIIESVLLMDILSGY